jgi:hypothetical protein
VLGLGGLGLGGLGVLDLGLGLGGLGLADELEGTAGVLLGQAGPARLLLAVLGELVEAALEEDVLFVLGTLELPGQAGEFAVEGALVLGVGGARHVAFVLRLYEGARVSLYMLRENYHGRHADYLCTSCPNTDSIRRSRATESRPGAASLFLPLPCVKTSRSSCLRRLSCAMKSSIIAR